MSLCLSFSLSVCVCLDTSIYLLINIIYRYTYIDRYIQKPTRESYNHFYCSVKSKSDFSVSSSLFRFKHPSEGELCALAGKLIPKPSKRDRWGPGGRGETTSMCCSSTAFFKCVTTRMWSLKYLLLFWFSSVKAFPRADFYPANFKQTNFCLL